jgi:hypothetical protein
LRSRIHAGHVREQKMYGVYITGWRAMVKKKPGIVSKRLPRSTSGMSPFPAAASRVRPLAGRVPGERNQRPLECKSQLGAVRDQWHQSDNLASSGHAGRRRGRRRLLTPPWARMPLLARCWRATLGDCTGTGKRNPSAGGRPRRKARRRYGPRTRPSNGAAGRGWRAGRLAAC